MAINEMDGLTFDCLERYGIVISNNHDAFYNQFYMHPPAEMKLFLSTVPLMVFSI